MKELLYDPVVVDLLMKGVGLVLASLCGLLLNLVKKKMQSDLAVKLLDRLGTAAWAAVGEVQQEYVAALKEGREDGKLTDEEKAEARARAVRAAKAYFGSKGLAELAKLLGASGNLDKLVGGAVEASLERKKSDSDF